MNLTRVFVPPAILVTLLSAGSVQAKSFELGKSTSVQVEVPKNWEHFKNLYGVPLMLLGPMKDGERPVISVAYTGAEKAKLDHRALAKDEKAFREGRERWLEKRGGKALAYDGYQKISIAAASEAGSVGYRYILDGTEFSEKTYLITCKGKLFYLKSTLSAAQVTSYQPVVDQIVGSFSCR